MVVDARELLAKAGLRDRLRAEVDHRALGLGHQVVHLGAEVDVDERVDPFQRGVCLALRLVEHRQEVIAREPEEARDEIVLGVVVVVQQRLALLELRGDVGDAQLGVAVLAQRAVRRIHDERVHVRLITRVVRVVRVARLGSAVGAVAHPSPPLTDDR